MAGLEANFCCVLKDRTAGDPMREEIIWTDLTPGQIAEALAEHGTPVSEPVVRQLLEEHGYGCRQARKSAAMGEHPDRDAQFRNIARLRAEYLASPDPILSIDTKKRELLGNFYRKGKLYTTEPLRVFDHDFPSFADGVVIPHGLYDLKKNWGYINLGTSHDTSEFACDSLGQWWSDLGRKAYPEARSLLLLCDGGGSNSAAHWLFKEDLQRLVDWMRVGVRVAHYPPYASKYNPIEHRLFPHLTRACQGVILRSVGVMKQLLEKARTATGLRVVVQVLDKVYQTGRKYTEGFKENNRIRFDAFLPKWNYRVLPATA
jgi:hypothetical protein